MVLELHSPEAHRYNCNECVTMQSTLHHIVLSLCFFHESVIILLEASLVASDILLYYCFPQGPPGIPGIPGPKVRNLYMCVQLLVTFKAGPHNGNFYCQG